MDKVIKQLLYAIIPTSMFIIGPLLYERNWGTGSVPTKVSRFMGPPGETGDRRRF